MAKTNDMGNTCAVSSSKPIGVHRLLALDHLLLMSHWKLPLLAIEFGSSINTVRRDIQTLQELGSDAGRDAGGNWTSTKAVFVRNLQTNK